MVVTVLKEAIRNICPRILPISPLALQMALYFHRKVGAISIIDKILYRNDNVFLRPPCGQRIIMVGNCNKPHSCRREYLLQIPPCLYILPAKTGKILHNNEINLSRFHIAYHLLKGRAEEIGTAVPIIHIFLKDTDIFPAFQKIVDKPLLVCDTVALLPAAFAGYIPVLFGKAQIYCRHINFLFLFYGFFHYNGSFFPS